jgi:ATP-binding cassette subfamily C (CFTR/MRP) protein 1
MQVLADWAISQWAQLNGDAEQSSWSRYGLILGLLALLALLSYLWIALYALRIQHSSKTLYQAMLTSVLLSPITYFDSTPVGRILNRFTKGIHPCAQSIG